MIGRICVPLYPNYDTLFLTNAYFAHTFFKEALSHEIAALTWKSWPVELPGELELLDEGGDDDGGGGAGDASLHIALFTAFRV